MFISHAGLWMQSLKSNLISKPPSQAPSGGGVGVVSHGDENLIVPPSDSTSPPLLPPRPTFSTFRGTVYHQRLPFPGPTSCCEVLIKISGILRP